VKFIHVSLRIKPDRAELYEETFLKLRALVLQNEPGCPVFEICRDPEERCVYHIFEAYADAEALKAHIATDYYRANARVFVECLEGDHMEEINRRGASGAEMYSLVRNIKFERFETI
jgi:quinol monooxygenase YgiN